MKISRIAAKNFRGSDFDFSFDGQNVSVEGENGSGKSTIFCAYHWSLTGKTPDGNEIKTYGADGKFILGKNPEVEIEFEGGVKILRRFVEKYGRNGDYTGNATESFINGEPVKESEFNRRMDEMMHGAVPFVTDPFYFCNMKYQLRRNLLMKMADVNDKKILESDESFDELKNLPGGMTIEGFVAANRSKIKETKEKLAGLPARIDEIQRRLSESEKPEVLKARLEELRKELKKKADEVSALKVSTDEIKSLERELSGVRIDIARNQNSFSRLETDCETEEKRLFAMRQKYVLIKNATGEVCPTCNQNIPAGEFERRKTERLKKLKEEGDQQVAKVDGLKAEIERNRKAREKLLKTESELEKKIKELESPETSDFEKLVGEREKISSEMTELNNKIARYNDEESRLKKCLSEQKTQNEKIAELERLINLAEKFTREKVRLTEGAVNSRFGFITFKMFETNFVGTVKEVCEPMIDGVPFSDLNAGAKLKAALDILKTLQAYFGVELPVFIDNAESYTSNSFVELPNQIILLKAVEGQKELVVKTDSANEFALAVQDATEAAA